MSIYVTAINGMGSATDSLSGTVTTTGMQDNDVMYEATDNIIQAGVKELGSDSFKVQEKGTPDMSVDTLKGACYVENSSYVFADGSNTKYWRVESTATENVSIDVTSANPRIDLVCVKVDTGVTPDDNASNVATIVVVKGTEAASPSAPALPNDHLLLAQVLVPNPVTSIVNSAITDSRVTAFHDAGQSAIQNDDEITGFTAAGVESAIIKPNTDDQTEVGSTALPTVINTVYKTRATRIATQTLTDNVLTVIQLNNAVFDPNSNFNSGTYQYTVPLDGYYYVGAGVNLTGTSLARCIVRVYDGSGNVLINGDMNNAAIGQWSKTISDILYLTSSTTLEVRALGNVSSGSVTVQYTSAPPFLSVHLLSI